jgi:hypothetical protein
MMCQLIKEVATVTVNHLNIYRYIGLGPLSEAFFLLYIYITK